MIVDLKTDKFFQSVITLINSDSTECNANHNYKNTSASLLSIACIIYTYHIYLVSLFCSKCLLESKQGNIVIGKYNSFARTIYKCLKNRPILNGTCMFCLYKK